jgi:hypothetical protein
MFDVAHFGTELSKQQADPNDTEEMQSHKHYDSGCNPAQKIKVLPKCLAESRCDNPQAYENRDDPKSKKQR